MSALFEALILGLIAGAVPGPILTSAFAETLNSGFRGGMKIVLWALIVESAGALLAILVFYQLGLSALIVRIISIVGAVVLFWIASQVWKITHVDSGSGQIISFQKIILLTVLNSGYWIFWLTIGVPKALLLDRQIVDGRFIYLLVFEIGWLLMTALLAFVFFKFRPLLQRKNLVGTTFKVLAVILILLGLKTLIGAI